MTTEQAKELGQKLIKTAIAIDGYQDFKEKFENGFYDLGVVEKGRPCNIPLTAVLNGDDVDIVLSKMMSVINNNIKTAQKNLDALMP